MKRDPGVVSLCLIQMDVIYSSICTDYLWRTAEENGISGCLQREDTGHESREGRGMMGKEVKASCTNTQLTSERFQHHHVSLLAKPQRISRQNTIL